MSCLEMDDAEICRVAEPMMDDIIRGVANRDYALHSRHMSVNLKSTLTQEAFLQACDQRERDWGEPGARELICIFRKPKSFTLIWNQAYSSPDAGQVLAVTTVAVKGGRHFVDSFLLE